MRKKANEVTDYEKTIYGNPTFIGILPERLG